MSTLMNSKVRSMTSARRATMQITESRAEDSSLFSSPESPTSQVSENFSANRVRRSSKSKAVKPGKRMKKCVACTIHSPTEACTARMNVSRVHCG